MQINKWMSENVLSKDAEEKKTKKNDGILFTAHEI